ncbi:bile acid transporter [Legionella steigerwaltii]|uniref:Bile acid transporter n=1 Tax=Legionella steigerwaltii TaxID=460 RepID=A0A378L8K7_9GAMM|nr:bile acid:sodium symporter family protein [Legionella steigerwaltii]KTD77727.1 Sodium Bile acid symporter family protein [Legionella steigerwaltii]STY23037.1 bile acid transporter [Legionella steigerwaltii]
MQDKIERYFIWIILLFVSVALLFPTLFIGFKGLIPIGLGVIMFGIGMNTPAASFKDVLVKPRDIIGLIIFRFMMMPFWALAIAYGLNLTQAETIGLLVLGAAPGGVAANVMAYLSKSNVALTVLLTFGSTLLSPIITPALIYWLLHKSVTIHFWSMVMHIGSIILLPILGGFIFSSIKVMIIEKIKSILPTFSIFMVAMIIASLFALNQQMILTFPGAVIAAVLALNLLGYFTGYSISYVMKQDSKSTLAAIFDYGMFDAIVAMVICTTFFSKEAAIPAVLISIIQNLTAPFIVRYQKKRLGFQIAIAKEDV